MNENLTYEFQDKDGKALLRELILYISQKCIEDPTFGATKLNKILFYADFYSYFRFGEPITGTEYQRLPNGPAPKQLMPVREKMLADGDVVMRKVSFFDKQQHRCIPMRDPDLDQFNGTDIAMVDDIIQQLWGKTATEVSEISHQIAWKIAKDRESIPYQAVFLSDNELTDADVLRVRELNDQHHWEQMRTLVPSDLFTHELERISKGANFGDALSGISWALMNNAEAFPLIPGYQTLRMVKTDAIRGRRKFFSVKCLSI